MERWRPDTRYGYCYENCDTRVVDFEEGTIIIDLVDRKTSNVVWRGWAQDAMDGVMPAYSLGAMRFGCKHATNDADRMRPTHAHRAVRGSGPPESEGNSSRS
jgi:Domain of unknown function (DUF4136)